MLDEEKAGWVAIEDAEFIEHTGMTTSELRRVKKYLAEEDLMHSRRMNGFTWYQINHESIASKIAALY